MSFDAEAKERALLEEANSWDTSTVVPARDGDIPIVDLGPWFASGNRADLDAAAAVLREALETVGFHQLVGHGIPTSETDGILAATRRFHALPLETKQQILMDRPGWPLGGSGYLPVGERKLPRRAQGNLNEAFLLKSDRDVGFDQNQWLPEEEIPGFRADVEHFAHTMEALALKLLPVYAVALDLEPTFFNSAFEHPLWRLRMTHYPPDPPEGEAFGIAPHVDTTFFTLLLTDGPGLAIYSQLRQEWIEAPILDGAFVVNAGELLRQWSNDRVLSTRHFANNLSANPRYSVPFFFNATSDHQMVCLPSCHDASNPPKYPPMSYRESQGVVQGE